MSEPLKLVVCGVRVPVVWSGADSMPEDEGEPLVSRNGCTQPQKDSKDKLGTKFGVGIKLNK